MIDCVYIHKKIYMRVKETFHIFHILKNSDLEPIYLKHKLQFDYGS